MKAHDTNQQPLPLPATEPREAYQKIRNFLAGRLVGATRDEALVEEVVKCLFCRVFAARNQTRFPDDAIGLAHVYRSIFSELKELLPTVFADSDEILLDPTSIRFIDTQLSTVEFNNPTRDPIGDVYEAFIGSAIRGSEGQFFTPQNAVRLLVDLVDPKPGERIIDPACGAGGFLSYCARRLIFGGTQPEDIANQLFGIDKDRYLTRLATAHVELVTMVSSNVFCADSLAWAPSNGDSFPLSDAIGTFDVVLTNPPFGSKIVAASDEIQRRFDLGYKWSRDRKDDWIKTSQVQSSVSPQILFLERCISLVKPGGRIGIVVPESLISGKSYRYVIQYALERVHVRAVIGMPENLFKTSGKGGTHTKTCLLLLEKKKSNGSSHRQVKVFMAEVKWCGHDSRGRELGQDELPLVGDNYRAFVNGALKSRNHLGYALAAEDIAGNVLAPRYYDPDVGLELQELTDTHDLITVQDLVNKGVLEITSGDEVGKLAYGNGAIPFVRTSDISSWEIKLDPKHCVGEDVFQSLRSKQDVREGDILMVRDGTYLIGTCAYVTKYDTRIVYQSHIYKLRVKNQAQLSPFLLLAVLSSPPVQRQIKAKRFTQDIIDSLGDRIYEIVLPIPKSVEERERITEMVKRSCHDRVEARELSRRASLEVVGLREDNAHASLSVD